MLHRAGEWVSCRRIGSSAPGEDEEEDRGGPDLAQPITKVRVRHHQVDQPAVLGTRCTRHAQRARVSWAHGALGLRLCSDLDHLDPSERAVVAVPRAYWT